MRIAELFSPLGKLAGRAIYFANFYLYFFNGRLSNGPIFTKISGLVDGCKGLFISLTFLISQGMLPWQPIKVNNRHFSRTNLLYRTAIPKRIAILQSYFKILNRMNFSTLYTILVTFGPVTPEIARVTSAPFWPRRQKSAYLLD